jgi:hypothetical protein
MGVLSSYNESQIISDWLDLAEQHRGTPMGARFQRLADGLQACRARRLTSPLGPNREMMLLVSEDGQRSIVPVQPPPPPRIRRR